jgi:hypothetical protein
MTSTQASELIKKTLACVFLEQTSSRMIYRLQQ